MKKLFAFLILLLVYSAMYGKIINPSDTTIEADKKMVIAKTVQLVFQNYSDQLDTLQKYYTSTAIMNYVDKYNKEVTANIQARIADKTYVHQFSNTEKSWIVTDYAEVAAILKERTLDRIVEIFKDVETQFPGVYTVDDGKIRCLAKEIRAEIKHF